MTLRREVRYQIPQDREGATLLEFLVLRFPYFDREGWTAAIVAGQVRVNEAPAEPARVLAYRDVVEYFASEHPEPAVILDARVVFDDADLLVLDKPGNLPCHPGGRHFNHTLWALLKERHGLESPIFINRLDRETSGLVVVARHERAAKDLRAQFAGREVEKRYFALVEGHFPAEAHAVGCMEEDTASPVRKKRRFRSLAGASPAEFGRASERADTRFRLLAVHGPVSAVEARPLTGRQHQIRATFEALGHPVVGDKLYGVDATIFLRFCEGAMTDADRARLRLDRQALHATSLRFRHPRTRQPLTLEAPLPADMADLIRRLDLIAASTP